MSHATSNARTHPPRAKTIFQRTRAAGWPAPDGATITVTATITDEIITITSQRDDLTDQGIPPMQVTLTVEDLTTMTNAITTSHPPAHNTPTDPVLRAQALAALRAGASVQRAAAIANVSTNTIVRWRRKDLPKGLDMALVHEVVRAWAGPSYARQAGIELLIRQGKAIYDGAPWIEVGPDGAMAGIDVTKLCEGAKDWPADDRCLIHIAASLLGGPPVDLVKDLPTDRAALYLALAAIAHAAGSHQHLDLARDETGRIAGFQTLPALYPWPDDGPAS